MSSDITIIINPTNSAETIYSRQNRSPLFRRKNRPKSDEVGDITVNTQFTAAHLRVQRDLADMEMIPGMKIIRKEDDWMEFSLEIRPSIGYWTGGIFEFKFNIPAKYPFDGPRVISVDKIYHPNIDLEGKICVNILRPWKPVYSMETVMIALLFLFTSPNPNDPLNNEAAADMRNNPEQFGKNVKRAMNGDCVEGVYFPKNKGFRF